ncbi:MAG: hypothetical protein ACREN8_04745 [Candidatus Dormibacteraceae bacterium]
MAKRKLTVNVDQELVTALKVVAARSHKHDYEVVEEALRVHLGLQNVLDRIWSGLGGEALNEAEAIAIATAEVNAIRAARPAEH